jgi:GNAT superfamily N-acetyltransferase
VTHHPTGAALLHHAGAFLEAHEAENGLILGLCAEGNSVKGAALPLWLSVGSAEAPVGVAVCTGYNIVLSRAPAAALAALVADLCGRDRALPGVTGPTNEARTFADLWTRTRDVGAETTMRQGVYRLTRVIPPASSASGALRRARPNEVDRIAEWLSGFNADAGLPAEEAERLQQFARAWVAAGTAFVWDDAGACVAMAGLRGVTAHGVRIAFVYTPPALRRRGYASACVAALSTEALASGRQFCMLYTDLANPTSNSIYRRIGYEQVGESVMIAFMPRS